MEEKIIEETHGIVKEQVINEDILNEENEKKVVVKRLPSFFVNYEKRNRIELRLVYSLETGAILTIVPEEYGIDFSMYDSLGNMKVFFEFTTPSYEQLSHYRLNSSFYNQVAQRNIVENNKLRIFLLRNHLKDWNVTDDEGNVVELKFDEMGSLEEECFEKVITVFPTLIDVALTNYEKKILLV